MKMACRAWGIVICLLLPGLAFLSGCESGGHFTLFGYTTKPPFNLDIRTVYVPIALNTTYIRGVEFDLTKEVIRALGTSPYRVTSDRNHADTELIMKVSNNGKAVILTNQLGENRDAEVRLYIEIEWRDLRPGHVGDILTNPKRFDPNEAPLPGEAKALAPQAVPLLITPTGTYTPELGGSNQTAQLQAVRRAATQIVHMMEVWR
jgi:hypothetical protein